MAPVLFGSKLKVGGDPENRVLPTFSFRTENRTPICSYPVLENVLELCRGIGYLMHRRGKSKSPHYAPPKGFYCPTFAPQKMLRYLEKYLENLGMLGVFL